MAKRPSITFSKSLPVEDAATLIVLTDDTLALGEAAVSLGIGDLVAKAAATAQFKGKGFAQLDILAPQGTAAARLIVFGLGKADELKEVDWSRLGGAIYGALRKGETASLIAERVDGTAVTAAQLAEIGLGALLRSYAFEQYKSRKPGDESRDDKAPPALTIVHPDAAKAKKLWTGRAGGR